MDVKKVNEMGYLMYAKIYDHETPEIKHDPSEITRFMLNNFHSMLKAQIEIGKETDISKINKILENYNIPLLGNE